MKRWMLLFLPGLIWGQEFTTLLKLADNNLLLKAKEQEITAKDALYHASKAKNYPQLDARLTAIYLKDTPTMNFQLPFPGMPPKVEVGKRPNYTGELSITYPIFSGFAISNLIEKAKLDMEKSRLEKQDTKRKLYMRLTELYSSLYSLNHAIVANKQALDAVDISYKKANGFYKAGLLAPSELANIKAKKFEISAGMQTLKNQRNTILKILSYLTNTKVDHNTKLPRITLPKSDTLLTSALNQREDILTLQKMLEMDKADIKLAKSGHYPTLAILGALKLQGDDLRLNGDGFTNPNKSYIGAAVEWKLFDGFATKHRIDAAKAKKIGRILYLKDYQNLVKATLKNEINTLTALQRQQEAKKAQLKAQESYYKLTQGRFSNHMAGADELSRAIAARAAADAEYETINAKIFEQQCKVLLESSLQRFEKELKLQ